MSGLSIVILIVWFSLGVWVFYDSRDVVKNSTGTSFLYGILTFIFGIFMLIPYLVIRNKTIKENLEKELNGDDSVNQVIKDKEEESNENEEEE